MDEDSKLRLTKEWADRLEELRHVSERIRAYLELVCAKLELESYTRAGPDFRVRFVDKLRVKEPASIIRKLQRIPRLKSIWEIDDIIGLRVVVVSPTDAEGLANVLMDDGASPLKEVKRRPPKPDASSKALDVPLDPSTGYRAIHITGRFGDMDPQIRCEIQIRTALQDLWAVISRFDLYQREGMDDLYYRASTLSDELARIDKQLQDVRDEAWRKRPNRDQLKVGPLAEPDAEHGTAILPPTASDSHSEKIDDK